MIKVKICGITNLRDAVAAVDAGSDALGFVFYKKSTRYIRPDKAKEIIRQIPKAVKKIGVFVNEREDEIKHIAKDLNLDMLQFHGEEPAEFSIKFKGYKIIKAFRIKDKFSLKGLKRYPAWAFLFDAYSKDLRGGTGKSFDWTIIKNIVPARKNIFLSGGLNAENVGRAVGLIKSSWVDVSSSVEIRPGKKDHKKIVKFIEAARRA